MEKTLSLKNGEILLGHEQIIIHDNARNKKIIRVASCSVWTIYGIISLVRYAKTADEFLLWSGAMIIVGHLAIMLNSLLRTAKAEVNLDEVGTAVFQHKYGNEVLDLQLKNGLIRRIGKIDLVSDELRTFLIRNNITIK